MSNSKRFASPILTAMFVATCLACGSTAAQNAALSKASQDATPAAREAVSGIATGKRMHKPMTMTMELDKQAQPHTMADMDTDKDGRLSRSEFAAAHGGKTDEFAAHDSNGDGFITQAEMDAHHAAMKAEPEAAHTVQQEAGKPHH
ncbi:EF-hand domain-containing protein [Thermomonas sp.]|uniref:EF-hand domain-containing protein n=1 Tax=Thermomonas sp. TaxID=1971895 RepID=UPI00248895F2|nr:EF-hand domain-containing protein [Thermomonas sp.]MDI1252844.1 EF-hand domain-containing protein [Thermomonas sp.]